MLEAFNYFLILKRGKAQLQVCFEMVEENYCAMSHPDGFCWSQSLTGCCNHPQQLWDASKQHEHSWINFSTVEVSALEFSWWWWRCNLWHCWNWLYFLACRMKIMHMKNVYSHVCMIKKTCIFKNIVIILCWCYF